MAYKIDKETDDIVISGWERGISSSPHAGLGDLKCLNITTMPGEVSVNFARIQQSQKPITGGTFTAGGSGFVVYNGSPSLLQGTWVTISASSISGLSTGTYYVLLNASSVNIQLSTTFKGSQITVLGLTGTATFTAFSPGKLIDFDYTNNHLGINNFQYFVLDSNGLVWENESGSSQWSLLQTTSPSSPNPSGIACYQSYVLVLADQLYYKGLAALGTAWAAFSTPANLGFNGSYPHFSTLTPSDLLVICDGSQLSTLMVNPNQSFSPTSSATYTWSPGTVLLPTSDYATCISLIGNGSAATGGTGGATNVIVGGTGKLLYPWSPGTSFFNPALFLSEDYTQQLQTVNNLVYVFSGSKGIVSVTNGTSLTGCITVPDYVANTTGTNQDPYFVWGGTMYQRGRIWFSVQAPNCGGIWSFVPTINYMPEQDMGISLRLEHQNSYGTYSGYATILFTPQRITDANINGVQYFSGWDDGTSGGSANPYGIDLSGTTPYTSFSGGTGTTPYTGAVAIETDLIPIGTLLNKTSFSEIEYKLSAPLVAGENVGINYRPNMTSAWLPLTLTQQEATNPISGVFIPGNNMQNLQWVQLQVILGSTITNPSYTRLTELRLR